MTFSLRTNIASLNIQSNLRQTSNDLSQTYERLSSGLRINRASDDPAGLALASRLKSDSLLSYRAVKNINDAISVVNVFTTALEEMSDILTKNLELATQAANETLSLTQRNALNTEANALVDEYNRIIASTTYNGIDLGATVGRTMSFQAGITSNSSISTVFADALGRYAGTGTFNTATTITGSGGNLVKGDFNADGIEDFAVTTGSYGTSIRAYFGNGSGSFSGGPTLSYIETTGSTPDLTAGDFNGDGATDLAITTGTASGSVRIFMNNGSGTFTQTASIASNDVTGSIKTGDFNGDGNIDIITGSTTYRQLYYGSGSGSFGAAQSLTSGIASGTNTTIGDFNGDGISDVAFSSTSAVQINLGSTSGTFTAVASFSPTTGMNSILAEDFNGDGISDLRVSTSTMAAIYLGTSSGTMSAGATYAVSFTSGTHANSFTADMNSDGYIDAVSRSTTGQVSYRLGNGDGTFGSQLTTSLSVTGSGDLLVEDYSGDGVDDIISIDSSNTFRLSTLQSSRVTSISHVNISTQTSALDAIEDIESAITRITRETGVMAAASSRLEVAVSNMQSAGDIFALAESRIMDVDTASETANMVRLQIFQKSAAAVLAQANLQPETVLKLLSSGDEE